MDGVDGKEGIYVYLCLIDVVWQKPTYRCNAIILQFKKKNKKNPVSKFGCILRYRGEGNGLHFNIRIFAGTQFSR